MKVGSNCGAELSADAEACPACGNSVASSQTSTIVRKVVAVVAFALSIVAFAVSTVFTVWYFTIADIGFLLVWVLYMAVGFTLSVISLALSIVAVCLVAKRKYGVKGFAIASLVMSALSFCMSLIIFFYPFILKSLA